MIPGAVLWLRLEDKRTGPRSLELELVAELHQVATGLWIARLVEQLRVGDRMVVTMPLEPAQAPADAPDCVGAPRGRAGERRGG
jgi:hypothetical protein